jgi:hypothetical protein
MLLLTGVRTLDAYLFNLLSSSSATERARWLDCQEAIADDSDLKRKGREFLMRVERAGGTVGGRVGQQRQCLIFH